MNIQPKIQILFILLTLSFFTAFSQTNIFQDKFSKLFDFSIIPKTNINFKEYYEITIQQSADHSNPKSKFNQRIYIGFQDFSAPTVIVTDGYAIDYASKPDYSNELAKELKANIVVVEHRFFGKSVPDSIEWKLLTLKQAADDYHFIKSMLGKILTGKWLSTGISKGGQAALSYKMFYPKDISAVVAYGTAVKSKQTVFTDTILSNLSQTVCGKKITELQNYLFRHKNILLPYFAAFVSQKNYNFTPLDNETVLDYLLLELPFSFWQNGNKCEDIPDTTNTPSNLTNYLIKVVPPRFFSTTNKKQLEPSFYMFYHELGYYEYNTTPFIKYLKQKNYSNNYFAPPNTTIQFDDTFQKTVGTFVSSSSSKNVFFIYGQNDPWALQTRAIKNVYIVPAGSHKSRIADFSAEQQADIYTKIRTCIK
ncbi:MAG: S28 family serine protease [Bacteroidota bacterium]|nr:S28 family serine protease [Bacteroidota bacterium]